MPPPFPSYVTRHSSSYPAISPINPALSAAGKTVVITGGGTGIGASIAKSFALAGASSIGIIGRREEPLKSTLETLRSISPTTKLSYATADITSLSSISNAFAGLSTTFSSPIHILISNAGYLTTPTPISTADPDDWWAGFEINIKGGFNSIRAFLPVAAPNAQIININSAIATLPALRGASGYTASKVASAKLFEILQKENPELFVVNLQPGSIQTDMADKSGFNAPRDDLDLPGHFTVWLCSPEATFLKGKFVWANWDVEELKAKRELIAGSHELEVGLNGVVPYDLGRGLPVADA